MSTVRFLTLSGACLMLSGFAFLGTIGIAAANQTTAALTLPVPTPQPDSLYKRLGGYDAIAAVSDDFIVRLVTDAKLSKFFVGLSDSSKARIRQLFVDQICAASGGPCLYIGRDMKTAHQGITITEDDWNTAVGDLTATFGKFNVGQRERSDLLAILTKIKPDVVTAK